MLDFFLNVQEAAAGGGGGGTFNGDGDPPETPTHLIHFPTSDVAGDRIEIWDVTTPSTPTKTASWNCGENYAYTNIGFADDRNACVKEGTAYFGASSDGIYSLDVSDPTTLGASQVLGQIIQSSFGISYIRFMAVHPTKSVLWCGASNGTVYTVDISNPASMSIIAQASSGFTAPNAYTMSKDGEAFFVIDKGTAVRYTLNASNQPSNATSLVLSPPWTAATVEALCWTENASGEGFLARAAITDDISIAEMDSSYGFTSAYTYTNNAYFDRGQAICGMPYVTNYSSDDLGVVIWNKDDYSISIGTVDTSTDTITARVESAADITWISQNATNLEAFDQYVFIMNNTKLAVYEWAALNTLNRIATIGYGTGPNDIGTSTNQMCLFKP